MSAPAAEVRVFRGDTLESVHRVSIALADAAGRLVFACGDVERDVFLRSAAKPFQAAVVLACGALDGLDVGPEELATMAASHSGEAAHVATVAGILRRIGLDERALRCGAHPPLHPQTAARIGTGFGPLHNNCSGKHAGMLALARRLGEPPGTYIDPDGLTQRRIREGVATACGLASEGIVRATDGCSAPTFAVPLPRAARAFARLVHPDGLPAEIATALGRIAAAMSTCPWHLGGTGRFDTDLTRAAGGRLVAKAGAEGVQGIADRESRLGLFLKVEDGAARAVAPAALGALRELGWLPAASLESLSGHGAPQLRNHAGLVVGRIEAVVPAIPPVSSDER